MSWPNIAVLAAVPLLVALLDLAERRFGSARVGWISSFPIVGAPALLVVTQLHGEEVGAAAATSAALGMVGWTAFISSYRFPIPWRGGVVGGAGSVVVSVAGWLLSAAVVVVVHPSSWLIVPILVGSMGVALRFGDVASRGRRPVRSALVSRATFATVVVVATVLASNAFGGIAAGLMTTFPIVSSSLLVPIALRGEADQVRSMAKGMLTAGPALASFMALLGILLGRGWGTAWSFAAATSIALAVHSGMWLLLSNRRRPFPSRSDVPVPGASREGR